MHMRDSSFLLILIKLIACTVNFGAIIDDQEEIAYKISNIYDCDMNVSRAICDAYFKFYGTHLKNPK